MQIDRLDNLNDDLANEVKRNDSLKNAVGHLKSEVDQHEALNEVAHSGILKKITTLETELQKEIKILRRDRGKETKESPPKTSPKAKTSKITASDGGSIELAETVEESEAGEERKVN